MSLSRRLPTPVPARTGTPSCGGVGGNWAAQHREAANTAGYSSSPYLGAFGGVGNPATASQVLICDFVGFSPNRIGRVTCGTSPFPIALWSKTAPGINKSSAGHLGGIPGLYSALTVGGVSV